MTDQEKEEDSEQQAPTQQEEQKQTFSVQELEQLSDSLKEWKEKYFLLLAESENTRKRMQKERQELTRYAVENVISDFLNPLDHFEKALEFADSASSEVKNWAIGFKMILNQFKDVLSAQGVVEYKSLGENFDPHLHEAVEMIETDEYPPGKIIEECVKGYKMGEKPIRVARVKVTKQVKEGEQS